MSSAHGQGVPTSSSIVLRPGDVVRITVWRKPELSGELLVAADSSLKHPLYQDVKIAGVPLSEAQRRIQEFLKRFEASPQVALEPLFRVAVGGEVRTPNLYSFPPETSVAEAVALAGGPSDRGRLDQVRLVRGSRETLLDLSAADGRSTLTLIQSGDRIFVGRRSDRFRDLFVPLFTIVGTAAAVTNLFIRR